jgi:hypothetical protein
MEQESARLGQLPYLTLTSRNKATTSACTGSAHSRLPLISGHSSRSSMSARMTKASACAGVRVGKMRSRNSPSKQVHFQHRTPGATPAQAVDSLACRPSDCATNHHFLDLAYRPRRIQTLRTDIDTVHDRVAAEQPIGILKIIQALVGRLVAGIGDEAVSVQQTGRADELVRIPPEGRTRGRTAGAQDALVKTVEFVALLGRLQRSRSGRGLSLIR